MKIDKEKYLSHISNIDDKIVMRRILDLVNMVQTRHTIESTDFLSPDLVSMSISILNRFTDIKYSVEGGFDNSERKIISIFPNYHYYIPSKDSPLRGIEIIGNIEDLKHSDVLGAILGLGIVREKVGDIAFFCDKICVTIHKDICDFLLIHLKQIGREYVKVTEEDPFSFLEIIEEGVERTIISSSMRLDSIVAEVYGLSRSISKKLIEQEFVKLNYTTNNRGHTEVEIKDLVSVRRYGRFRLVSIDGTTRRDNYILTVFQPQ